MTKKRKQHSAEFKAKVDLEAVKEVHTVQPLAKGFQANPTRITIL